MKIERRIVYSLLEPPRDFIWAGRDTDGNYFLKIWMAGWRTIAGGQYVSKLVQGEGISVTGDSDTGFCIAIEGKLYDEIKSLIDNAIRNGDVDEITADEVLEKWNSLK